MVFNDIDRPGSLYMSYLDSNVVDLLAEYITYSLVDTLPEDITILCIGSDRSTGDALGPLVGTMLTEDCQVKFDIKGVLGCTANAQNLNEICNQIDETQYVIVIDAGLAESSMIGNILIDKGSIIPGDGVGQGLFPVGHMKIIGFINRDTFDEEMNYKIIQNTSLGIVYPMAQTIAKALAKVHNNLDKKVIE